MPTATDEPRTEQQQVEDWRETVLFEAGYPPAAAIELSRLPHVDLHRAVELLRAGCNVETAVEILR